MFPGVSPPQSVIVLKYEQFIKFFLNFFYFNVYLVEIFEFWVN